MRLISFLIGIAVAINDLLPIGIPIFYLKIPWPSGVLSIQPAWFACIPARLPIIPVIFGFTDGHILDISQLLQLAGHEKSIVLNLMVGYGHYRWNICE